MDLIPNATFRLIGSSPRVPSHPLGIYRVILRHMPSDIIVVVLIYPEDEQTGRSKGGRKPARPKAHTKKPPSPLVGALKWLRHSDLVELELAHLLVPIDVEVPATRVNAARSKAEFDRRIDVMQDFLDQQKLEDSIVESHGLSGLIAAAVERSRMSRAFVYRQWSNLCRWGLSHRSLAPRHDRCGAPGVVRPIDPLPGGGFTRKKAGRKSTSQRLALMFDGVDLPGQPGMSSEWAAKIRVADALIPIPKPKWPDRCKLILSSAFCGRAKEVDGRITIVPPEQGTYPNQRQIRRAVEGMQRRIERLLEKTTHHHFESNHRGLTGRNWENVAGPGHTWAIDSTVGDIYLRSSVNRAWIVGRPIVYVIVDIWSTAVVGFHVALTGPSWSTAKVSLFNAAADPNLLGELWGYVPVLALNPVPTLPYVLLCDRGEYLSKKHRETARKLLQVTNYTPPYRGDLKGLAEVLHRIEKDKQFFFIPGAMDYRRKELEMRRVNPEEATLTVREYVHVLQETFTEYNLTADRSKRVDAHMAAARVFPSPAGIWHWGHETGIGFRRHSPEHDLISELLPVQSGRVRRDAVRLAGLDYMSQEVKDEQWTTLARNFGGWEIPLYQYPGVVEMVWTPHPAKCEMLRLHIADEARASPETTFDEWLDFVAYEAMRSNDIEHQRMVRAVQSYKRLGDITEEAQRKTKEALAAASGARPTITEAREIEVAMTSHPSGSKSKSSESLYDEAMAEHSALLASLIERADAQNDR